MAKKKEDFLKSICKSIYGTGIHIKPTIKTYEVFSDEIYNVYKNLGGILDEAPVNIGDWDIDLKSCIIEFDEENHFNRYRLITLNSKIYDNYINFNVDEYKNYCKNYEKNCRTDGGYWRNDSSDRQFGISSPEGDFNGNGSSRWKQRAYYDFLKDIYSLITQTPVIRISIYDKFKYSTIGQLITNEESLILRQFIRQNLSQICKSTSES